MPSQMIACPHCGTANSEKKQACFQCQTPLRAPGQPRTVQTRPLRAKASPVAQMPAANTTLQGNNAGPTAVTTKPSAPTAVRPITPARQAQSLPQTSQTKSWQDRLRLPQVKMPALLFGGALRHRIQFYTQLYQMLKSGIPLGVTFEHVGNQLPRYLRPMARKCQQHIQAGGLLSAVMATYPSLFPEWERSLVQAAEQSGALPEAMHEIAATLEIEENLRREVNAKTLHLKATAAVAFIVVLMQSGLGRMIGASAATVLESVGNSIMFGALLIAGFMLALRVMHYFGRTPLGASINQMVLPKIPLIGPILYNSMRLRFATVLGALWGAGVAPMESLRLAANASGDLIIKKRAELLVNNLGRGESLADIVEQLRLLSPEAMYLLRTGEISGNLSEALHKVAEYLRFDLDIRVKELPIKLQLWFYAILVPIVGYLVINAWTGYFDSMFDSVFKR